MLGLGDIRMYMKSFLYCVLSVVCCAPCIVYGMNPQITKGSITPEGENKGPLSCRHCGTTKYVTQRSLTRHEKHYCQSNPTWRVLVCECGKEFNGQGSLSKHMKSCPERLKKMNKMKNLLAPREITIQQNDTTCQLPMDNQTTRTLVLPAKLRSKFGSHLQ